MKMIIALIAVFMTPFLASASSNSPTSIDKPVLLHAGGNAKACLEKVLRMHTEDPFENFGEWKGPGVRANSSGQIDPSTALYIFEMLPSGKWYSIAFYSQDDIGWQLFTYDEDGKLKVGYRARNMEATGYLFRVQPRDVRPFDGTIPYIEIDLSPCKEQFKRF